MKWLWWILGIGAAGTAGYLIVSAVTGRGVLAGKACVADLGEADRAAAKAAVDSGDPARMTALATRFDGAGFTCAAAELRAASMKARAAASGIDDVAELDLRSAWRKLIDRSLSEADPGGELVASLEAASRDAEAKGYSKVRDLLRDASRDVRRTMHLARITEEPPAKAAQAAVASRGGLLSKKEKATAATVASLRALEARLRSLGYVAAADEVKGYADADQKELSAGVVSLISRSTEEFGPVLAAAFATKPSDPVAGLPDDVRAEVQAAYDSGDPQQLDDVAATRLIPYPSAWKKVKEDAAEWRRRWYAAFADLPIGEGSVFAEIDASGDATIPGSMPSEWGRPPASWEEVRPIADALWSRGYRTAANQLGHQWSKFKWGIDAAPFMDSTYPLPP